MQNAILKWWFYFQKKSLSDEQCVYSTTTRKKDLIGFEADCQVDLLVKCRGENISEKVHNWKNVQVVDELKSSNYHKKETLLQIGWYIHEVFTSQPTRWFVHAFSLCGREMELWVFDCSSSYSSDLFDIYEQPEQFVQVIAGYIIISDEELGLDTFT